MWQAEHGMLQFLPMAQGLFCSISREQLMRIKEWSAEGGTQYFLLSSGTCLQVGAVIL